MAAKGGASINWGGLDTAVDNGLRAMADKKPLLRECAEVLVSGTLKRFQDERDPDGKPWAPTRRGGKILTNTAGLQKSIDSAITEDSVMVGSNKEYAGPHQTGAVIKPKKGKYLKFRTADGNFVSVKQVTIPKRSYLGVSKEDREEISETIKDHLAAAFKGK